MKNRTLYFGDNLEILRKKIPDESFDLIYLDPPFNSNRSYNVLFKEGLQDSPAQIRAFEDSWHWNNESVKAFDYLVTKTNADISNLMQALEKILGHNDVMAYLTMMTIRLIELSRVLKKTGSIYLHCDPTASHYLKIVMDVIFGKKNFRNEIIWNYRKWAVSEKMFSRNHDIILFYSKSVDNCKYNILLQERAPSTLKRFGTKKIVSGFTEEGKRRPSETSEEESAGVKMSDVWDVPIIAPSSSERLRYPTQKPEKLLERIVKASSSKGGWVLDPFCGCGTTVAVAERLKRSWVGIDITVLAINLVKKRLRDQLGLGSKQINVDGLPTDLAGAKELAKKDPFAFEIWALDLIEAMPAPGKTKESMRGADKGIDGILPTYKGQTNNTIEYGKIIVQVKSGGVQRNQVATLKSDVEREKADGGIFITLEKPTRPMISEAADAGTYTISLNNKEFPKIQILTIDELLRGKKLDIPLGFPKKYYKEAKPVNIDDESLNQEILNLK